MSLQKSFWIFSLLICFTFCFVVDHNNYFYLNTSYAKQTVSFSMNFRVSEPTQIKLISPILIPQGNHIIIGLLQKDKSIAFDNPFNSDLILYNSYEDGEHWFGVKLGYENPNKYDFARIELGFKQQTNVKDYIFLAPLFTLPLNGIQVFPLNTLYSCHQSVLLSYYYNHSEVDFYAFGRKDTAKVFKVDEKKDWGFFRQDFTSHYLRHKSKSKQISQVTLSYSQKDGKNYECKISKQFITNQKSFQSLAEALTVEQILKSSTQLYPDSITPNAQL